MPAWERIVFFIHLGTNNNFIVRKRSEKQISLSPEAIPESCNTICITFWTLSVIPVASVVGHNELPSLKIGHFA